MILAELILDINLGKARLLADKGSMTKPIQRREKRKKYCLQRVIMRNQEEKKNRRGKIIAIPIIERGNESIHILIDHKILLVLPLPPVFLVLHLEITLYEVLIKV